MQWTSVRQTYPDQWLAQVEGRGGPWNSFIFFSDPDGNPLGGAGECSAWYNRVWRNDDFIPGYYRCRQATPQ